MFCDKVFDIFQNLNKSCMFLLLFSTFIINITYHDFHLVMLYLLFKLLIKTNKVFVITLFITFYFKKLSMAGLVKTFERNYLPSSHHHIN